MNGVDAVLDKSMLDSGIEFYYKFPLSGASSLIFGPSNSGKSVLTKSIIARISLYVPDAKVTICDGKADDYTFLRNVPNARHYEYLEMATGLTNFFEEFERRVKGEDSSRDYRLIALEEWSSYLRIMEEVDKKTAKTSLAQLFSITSQGRAYNVHALVSLQRPDSTFLSGFRENLTTVIGLGRISPEASRMVGFNEFPEFSGIGGGQGVGYMLTEQGQLNYIKVPRIRDFDKLHHAITLSVTQ